MSCDEDASAIATEAAARAGPASASVPAASAEAVLAPRAFCMITPRSEIAFAERGLALLDLSQALEDLVPQLGRRQRHRPHKIGIRVVLT